MKKYNYMFFHLTVTRVFFLHIKLSKNCPIGQYTLFRSFKFLKDFVGLPQRRTNNDDAKMQKRCHYIQCYFKHKD